MANIDIFNLDASGSELFNDSENFLADLDEQESGEVGGGYTYYVNGSFAQGISISVQSVNGNTVNANTIGNVNTVR